MNYRMTRKPDFEQLLRVLNRSSRPTHLPHYEHLASAGFIARATGTPFHEMSFDDPDYWRIYVQFWLDMGYDGLPMEIPLNCPLAPRGSTGLSHGSESLAVIRNREEFERYPWPPETNPIDFRHFETVRDLLPEGMKIVGGAAGGPYEWVSQMMGTVGLSYALADDPELVELVFQRVGALHHSTFRTLAQMDWVGALRQGDDLGFKTSTFLSPDDLRRLVFPIYQQLSSAAHEAGKPFILHSCGNLQEVYDDLIDTCRIDAKHSFEDVILPVGEFKRRYGDRVTPLGGLDVDVICTAEEDQLRSYARRHIDECFYDGFWAMGTGNSLTDYMPVENYMIVLDEAIRYTG